MAEHDEGHDSHEREHKKHKKHHAHGAHAEHEHEEGWIVSFADNVLLMMGFFVILLAMNMGPKGSSEGEATETAEDRLLDVAIAVREAFHNPVSLNSTRPEDQPLVKRLRRRTDSGMSDGETPKGEPARPEALEPTDWAGDGGFVQFGEKETVLDNFAKEALARLAQRLKGKRWIVEVRGHASRWETGRDTRKSRDLAYARAWAVGSELVHLGLSWDQIRLVSSGSSAPVIARARTADEAQTNQRTEILVLNETMPADPYSSAPAGPDETPKPPLRPH